MIVAQAATGGGPVSTVLTLALEVYFWVLIAHVVFSWVPRPPEPLMPFVIGVRKLVEPVVAPLRRVIPPLRLGGVALDMSIVVVFLGIRIFLLPLARSLPF